MIKKPNNPASVTDTVIADGVHVKGDIQSNSDVWVDSAIDGNIVTDSDLGVGENGHVNGNIRARNVVIAGSVEGDIDIMESATLEASARVSGKLTAADLSVDSGAKINGEVAMHFNDSIDEPEEEE